MNWNRIRHLVRKEFIQTFRDPRMRPVIFVMPILQLLLFGYAVNTDVRHVSLAVWDEDGTAESRSLTDRFAGSGYFDVVAHPSSSAEARKTLDESEAQAVLHVERGFGGRVGAGRTAHVQLLTDGSDSNTAGVVLQYGNGLTARYAREVLESRLRRMAGTVPRAGEVETRSRAWFNGNLDSRFYYVPGVMAILVSLITLLLTAMAVVREREIGTLEQLQVTPVAPSELILGKTLPFAAVALFDVILVTSVAVGWFGVPIRGHLITLLGATAVYLLSTLGVGLLISTFSSTQQQAMMTTFFFFMPAVMLSGFMFPVANMPLPVQYLTWFNPMRHYMNIVRVLFLKGAGWAEILPEVGTLLGMGLTMVVIASRRFHRMLD